MVSTSPASVGPPTRPRFRQLSPDLHNRPRGGLSSAIVMVIVIFAAESMPPSLLGSLPDSAWLRVKSQCACIPEATCPPAPATPP